MNTRLIRFLFGAIIASAIALSLFVLPMPTRAVPTASTFTVNTQYDGVTANACANNTPGQCTLREAILEANATSGATINLPGLPAGQFYYVSIISSDPDDGTTGDLHVDASMNIVGKPTVLRPSVIVDASLANDRVFTIGSAVTVSISNVTIRHGAESNGGGISNSGTLMLINSTVFSNTASSGFGYGGGIFNAGALSLTNSTVSGNTTINAGGGIYNNTNATLMLTSSTVSSNMASIGGVYQNNINRTIRLENTIIANSPSGGNCAAQAGSSPLISNGYNLSSDGSCATYFNQTGDLNNTNPQLGPLANNGDPTLTHALLPGSPAIDKIPLGTNGCGTTITTDQRGTPRPIGPRCDMGAYEARYFYLFLPLIAK